MPLYCKLIDQQNLGNNSKASKASKSQPNATSADVTGSNTPNAGLYAMPLQHTQSVYKHRFQSAPSIVASSSNPASTALQVITNVSPPNTVRGVKHWSRRVQCLQHPMGKYVLLQQVMQQFPQKSRQWLLARQGCVTGSSCSILLGLYGPVEPSVVPKVQQQHKRLTDLVKLMPTAEHNKNTDSKTAFNLKWGHLHEANAYETVLEL